MQTPTNSPSILRHILYSRSIRYFWRWFAELLIPLFIFSFVGNYTETGLLAIIYELSAVIFLPFIGQVADKRGWKKLLIIALFLYPIIWLSYFTAGLTQLAVFVIVARIINGVTWSLYKIGEKTFMRKYAPQGELSTRMGLLISIGDFVWMIGVILGGLILYYTSIPLFYLFLFIVPTALIALIPIWKLPSAHVWDQTDEEHSWFIDRYLSVWRNFWKSGPELKFYSLLYFVVSILSSMVSLMIPLLIYIDTSNILLTVVSGLIINAPSLFSYSLWKIADKKWKKWLGTSFILLALLFLWYIFMPWYIWKLAILFAIGVIFVFLEVLIDWQSNNHISDGHYWKTEAIFHTMSSAGDIIWPILWWIILDTSGQTSFFVVLAVIAVVVWGLWRRKIPLVNTSWQ